MAVTATNKDLRGRVIHHWKADTQGYPYMCGPLYLNFNFFNSKYFLSQRGGPIRRGNIFFQIIAFLYVTFRSLSIKVIKKEKNIFWEKKLFQKEFFRGLIKQDVPCDGSNGLNY